MRAVYKYGMADEHFILSPDRLGRVFGRVLGNQFGVGYSKPSTAITVTAEASGDWPWGLGEWESAGVGYSNSAAGHGIDDTGAASAATLGGELIWAIGAVTGAGFTPPPRSPIVLVVMPIGLAQDFFSQVTMQLAGGTLYTFDSSAAYFNPTIPSDDTPGTIWAWEIADASDYFVDGETTACTFS